MHRIAQWKINPLLNYLVKCFTDSGFLKKKIIWMLSSSLILPLYSSTFEISFPFPFFFFFLVPIHSPHSLLPYHWYLMLVTEEDLSAHFFHPPSQAMSLVKDMTLDSCWISVILSLALLILAVWKQGFHTSLSVCDSFSGGCDLFNHSLFDGLLDSLFSFFFTTTNNVAVTI